MPVFIIPNDVAVILAFILWFVIHVAAAIIAREIPAHYLTQDAFLFKARKWEQGGMFYQKYFKVKRWKEFLPDGAAILKRGYEKKRLTDLSSENLELFLLESRRAELTHLLGIFPFWIFGLFLEPQAVGYMFIYALVANLPCVIAQRYNRPRILKLLAKRQQRNDLSCSGSGNNK